MAGFPLQRNQQQYIVINGVRYDWNTDVGKYLSPAGMGLDGFKVYLLQPNQQPTIGDYAWNYQTGKYTNAKGEVLGAPDSTPLPNSDPIPTPTPEPTPTPPPPPIDMSWRANDQYNSIYGRHQGQGSYFQGANGGPLDTTTALQYQTAEGRPLAYHRFVTGEADPNSYYGRWLANQQGNIDADFKNASMADVNLQYPRYLDSRSQGLVNTYNNLPGWQQGKNTAVSFAGRRM